MVLSSERKPGVAGCPWKAIASFLPIFSAQVTGKLASGLSIWGGKKEGFAGRVRVGGLSKTTVPMTAGEHVHTLVCLHLWYRELQGFVR